MQCFNLGCLNDLSLRRTKAEGSDTYYPDDLVCPSRAMHVCACCMPSAWFRRSVR